MSDREEGAWPRMRRALRLPFSRGRVHRDVCAELAFHLEERIEELVAGGISRADAEVEARRRFGDTGEVRARVERIANATGQQRRYGEWLDALRQDVGYALRALRHQPTFTVAAIFSLGIGLGATTVVYSIVDAVVLRPLTYRDAGRLVVVREVVGDLANVYPTMPANAGHFLEWKRRCTACESMGAVSPGSFTLTGAGEPERLGAARVSADLFPLLGVQPRVGRGFTSDEDQVGRDHVVIITDGLWRRRFGADPAILGRTVTLDEHPFTIVGVLPPSFRFPTHYELGALLSLPERIEIFKPLALEDWQINSNGQYDFGVIVRLRAGVTVERARAELDALEHAIAARGKGSRSLRSSVTPLRDQIVGGARDALVALLAGVGAVMLIVCANLANLLLARNAARTRERAIRVALGAGRARVFSQALVESLLIAVAGGMLGLLIARWGIPVLMATAPGDLPRAVDVALDGRVLVFALALSIATGLLFGTLPALRAADIAPADALRGTGRAVTEDARGARFRKTLVIAEVALSTGLLVTAGLFIASLASVLRMDKGFDIARVVVADVTIPYARYDTPAKAEQFFTSLLAIAAASPGVTGVAVTNKLPLQGEAEVNSVVAEHDTRPDDQQPTANIRFVSSGYFASIGTAIRRGRDFTDADRNRPVVILSESAARAVLPGVDPIGRRVQAGDPRPDNPIAEVIGVAADVHTTSLEDAGTLIAYRPFWRGGYRTASILVRTNIDAGAAATTLRAAVARLDAAVPLQRIRTMRELVSASTARRRFETVLMGAFSATALLVAALGIYGVLAYSMARRTTELGIRLALGARPSDVRRLAMREGLTPVAIGLGIGVVLALAAGRVIASLLFQVRPADPRTFTIVVSTLAVVALIASWIPASRAARVDPVVALKE